MSHPEETGDEKDHSFTECACYADNIKDTFGGFQYIWHFIDTPYLDEGGSVDDYDFTVETYDVIHALQALSMFLKNEEMSDDLQDYINQIAYYFPDEGDQRSFALRMIIHYCGDISQPLHATTEIDSEFPSGDLGGNLQSVYPSIEGVDNLHSIWDSVIYEYPGYPVLPLDDASW